MATKVLGGVVALCDIETGQDHSSRLMLALNLDEDELTYTLSHLSGDGEPVRIQSSSPEVCGFYRQILGEIQRLAAAP